MTIGDRVKMLRIQKDMTQLELAKKLGYKSKSSVAHIENGRDIPRAMVVTLADALDTTPAFLMGWEDKKAPADDWSELSGMLAAVPADKLEQLTKTIELMSQNPDGDWLGLVELLAQVPKSDYVLVEGFLRGVTAKGGQDK